MFYFNMSPTGSMQAFARVRSSAASDVYKRQYRLHAGIRIMTACASASVAMLIISYKHPF